MRLARTARGRRFGGISATLALLCLSGSAVASSGGGGVGGPPPRKHHSPRGNPLNGRGMWIWYVSRSDGGNVSSIIARARRNGISTLLIKSGDGTGYWSQLSRGLISSLHAAGLHVCGWQFVYGTRPVAEAKIGAEAVHNGADCLMIDAEGQYEGRYVQAQSYVRKLRAEVGSRFPLALAGFPYVDYHPAFPYSVFLGPGGAQYNAPQMYWRDIGVSVDQVYSHTFSFNRIYGRAIFPVGEAVVDPPATPPPPSQIKRFREVSRMYGSSGVSWWMWQGLSGGGWHAISERAGPLRGFTPETGDASVGPGTQGDLVVWAQEHLVAARERVSIDGSFGPKTKAAVEQFQHAHGLPAIGVIGPATWNALLRLRPARVTWVTTRSKQVATTGAAGIVPVPASAHLPAKRYEIPRALGSGPPRAG